MPDYRVPVVVFTVVDGVDYGDAANIAEHAVVTAVHEASEREALGVPVIGFVRRGHAYEARVESVSSIDRLLASAGLGRPGLDIVDVRGREVEVQDP
jgi:hypothetical protein